LKPERWGSLLVQEKYREEMSVTRDIHNNNNNNNEFVVEGTKFNALEVSPAR